MNQNIEQKHDRSRGIVFAVGREGHRGAYLDLFSTMFGLETFHGALNQSVVKELRTAERLLFCTLDDTVAGFGLIAVLRSLFGRRTVGILLRPQSCRRGGGPKAFAKYWMFRMLKWMPKVSVLSIVPHPLCPDAAAVSSHWVHDPQLWDYTSIHPNPDLSLRDAVVKRAAGRRVLVFVGTITPIKGVALLAKLAPDLAEEYLIVAAGRVSYDAKSDVSRLIDIGAMVVNRTVTDQEIEALYDVADLVWCCYRPDYDQASGIFGRAVQFGRPAVVREGAMIARYAELAPVAVVPIPWLAPDVALQRLKETKRCGGVGDQRANLLGERWHDEFKKLVNDVL